MPSRHPLGASRSPMPMYRTLAVASEFAAELQAVVLGDARRTAEAAAKVSRVVAPFKQDPLRFRTILESEIRAWIHVIEAYRPGSTGMFSSEHAAARVEELCAPFDSDAMPAPPSRACALGRGVSLPACANGMEVRRSASKN